ncbi:hypothetical protein V2I75_16815 [Pseudomonas viridiflava]|uniref:hypothetical protein n=1 Tax=Pseudomonas viridiflava TaxID=33069 RepID=UPI002E9A9DDB|nr:hypothetical protein [Pseudomonas viridiflava]
MQVDQTSVENNWNYGSSFPHVNENEIPRQDILDTLSEIFSTSIPIVFLEGESGIGASVTLGQFVKKNENFCFSLFLSPSSRLSYDIDYIRVKIAEQLKIFLDGVPFEKGAIDEAEYGTLINRTRSKFKGKTAYFVVDGLNHIPTEDEKYISSIMNIALPIGVEGFRFLISGPQERLSAHLKKINSKPYQLKRFTNFETEHFFGDLGLSVAELDEIKQICRGVPGRVSAVRRQLKSGATITEILSSSPDKYLDFVKLDFKNFDTLQEPEKNILAIVAFSKQLVEIKDINEISGISIEEIRQVCAKCTFIEIKQDNRLNFISNAHRKLAESKLSYLQAAINDMQINHLKQAPTSDASLIFLASYLQQTNKNKELIELLTSEHYHNLLESTQSLGQLKNRAEIGLSSAHHLKSAIHAFQFSLQKSLFIDLSKSSASKSEINALVALGKAQHAMILVESAVTKISKLSLLTAYASGLKKTGKNIEPFIIDQISTIALSIDFSGEDPTSSQIAEDLLHIDVNLAIEILEKSVSRNDARKRDLALSRLSMIAMQEKNSFASSSVGSHIKNQKIQAFTSAFAHFHKDDSSESLIAYLQDLPNKNKIRLLINFISAQRKREGASALINYCLDLIIKDSTYLPKAKDYADLAAPLRYLENSIDELIGLVARFDGQSGLIKISSVTRDWVRLSASLAYIETKFDKEAAYNRLLNTYYDVCELSNYEIQSECYARLLYALKVIDPNDVYEEKEGLKKVIEDDLKEAVNELLKNAASQYDCISSILPAMVEHDLDEALQLSDILNTRDNRFLAYTKILELLIQRSSTLKKCEAFTQILSKLTDTQTLHDSLLSCTEILRQRDFDLNWAQTLSKSILRIKDPACYAQCATNIYRAFEISETPLPVSYVTDSIEKLISSTRSTASRNEICFSAIEAIAKRDIEAAEKLYHSTASQRNNFEGDSADVQTSFLLCLGLVVRAVGAALSKKILDEAIVVRLATAIGKLSSLKNQISLFNDLACRAWVADNMLQKIVSEHCRPLLDRTKISNESVYKELLEICFPSLYVANGDSSLKEIEILDDASKNAAIFSTCELLRRRLTKYDPPPNDDNDIHTIDYQRATDILTLLEHMTYDSAISLIVKKITASVAHKKNKHNFTQQQKKDISDRLLKIANTQLPEKENIQHLGYRICVSACAYTLADTNLQTWQSLIDQAKAIPNVADKAFVLIHLARSLPGKELALKQETLKEAESSSEAIPSLSDKLGRLELYSLACKDLSVVNAKNVLKRSLQMSHDIEDFEEAAKIQKSLIDVADQIEPGYADALLELFDDDPARRAAKAHAKYNIDLIKAKKDLADSFELVSVSDDFLADASWKNLSSLQTNRITPKPLFAMAGLISPESQLGLNETYPFLCWYIENASRKSASMEESRTNIEPLCEVLLLATELAFSIVSSKNPKPWQINDNDTVVGLMVTPNTRTEAINFIQKWLNLHCVDYIKFCDPYFTSEDIEIVQLIQASNPSCKVHILANASYLKKRDCASSEAFEDAWNNISDQTAPETYIYGIGNLEGKELIHDRWLLSNGHGLRIGTSINSLGTKLSEISVMTPSQFIQCQGELNKFLDNQVYIDGQRVKVTRYQI